MTTFFYVAVSNTDRKKMTGQIDAADENTARGELNKMGLSLLTIGTDKPAEMEADSSNPKFEFEGKERSGKPVSGTVDATNLEAAYDRLLDEFKFEICYLCPAEASAEDKARARELGVQPILDYKKARAEAEDEAKRKSLKGQFENMFKSVAPKEEDAEKKEGAPKRKLALSSEKTEEPKTEEKKSEPTNELVEVASETKTEDSLKEAFSDGTKPKKKLGLSLEPTIKEESNPEEKSESEFVEQETKTEEEKEGDENKTISSLEIAASPETTETNEEPKIKTVLEEEVVNEEKTEEDSPAVKINLFGKISFKKPNIKMPELDFSKEGIERGAKNVLKKIKNGDYKKSISEIKTPEVKFADCLKFVRHVLGALAIFCLAIFVISALALKYDWGSLSHFANDILANGTTLPFLAFSFLLFYLLTLLAENFHFEQKTRSGLLFMFGGLVLLVAGINFLY